MAALAHGTPCGARRAYCAPCRVSATRTAAARARWVAVKATEDGRSPTETSSSSGRDVQVSPLAGCSPWVCLPPRRGVRRGRAVAGRAPRAAVGRELARGAAFTQFLASALDPGTDLETSAAAVERIIASDDVVVFNDVLPFGAAAKQALAAEVCRSPRSSGTRRKVCVAPALARRTGRSSIRASSSPANPSAVQRREPNRPPSRPGAGRQTREMLEKNAGREGGVPGEAVSVSKEGGQRDNRAKARNCVFTSRIPFLPTVRVL